VDLNLAMSRLAGLFSEQSASELRKLLHLVLENATWKHGGLQMTLKEPFEALRVTDRVSPWRQRPI
jgi:hypothetical protein